MLILAALAVALFLFFSPSQENVPPAEKAGTRAIPAPEEGKKVENLVQEIAPLEEKSEDSGVRADIPAVNSQAVLSTKAPTQLKGTIVDSSGKPIDGVEVSLFEGFAGDFGFVLEREVNVQAEKPLTSAKTGADGRFHFPDLRFGDLSREGGKFSARLQFDRQGFVAQSPQSATLAAGMTREMPPIVLFREGAISGRLEAPGLTIASPRVSARKSDPGDLSAAMSFALASKVEEDGRFEIRGLSPGKWVVIGGARGLLPASSSAIAIAEGERKGDVVLQLKEGLSIQGRVLGPRGEPVSGAEIALTRMMKSFDELREHGPVMGGGFGEKNLTDARGHFVVAGLHPGEYALRVKAKGYSEASRSGVEAGSSGIDFTLGERGSILGTLLDETSGKPVASAKVSVQRQTQGFMVMGSGRDAIEAQSDTTGAFRLDSLEPGRYRLEIGKDGFAPKTIGEVLVEPSRETALGTIAVGHGARLLVQVVESAGEKSIANANARLTALSEDGRENPGPGERRVTIGGPEKRQETRQARADARGVASFENLPAGRYRVEANDSEHAGAKEELILAEGEERSVTLRLALGASVCGKTLAVDGGPYPAASVRLLSEAGEKFESVSDAQGQYCLRHIPAGKYWAQLREDAEGMDEMFQFEGLEQEPEGIEVLCSEGQDLVLDLRATPKGSLSGVVRQAGSPTEGVRVNVSQGSADFGMMVFGSGAKFGSSNAEGSYLIEKIKPGKYTVSAARPGAALPVKASFEIVPGENRLDLEIPGGTIEGVVLDAASGKPVEGARVVAEEDKGGQRRQMMAISISMDGDSGAGSVVTSDGPGDPSRTDSEGKFRLRDLPAGKFRLRVKDTAGYADKELSGVDLAKDEKKQGIEIKLDRGGSVRGRLLDDAGNPVSFAILFLEKLGGSGPPKIAGAGPDGKFRFDGVLEGNYKLRSGMQGEEGASVELTVKAGQVVEKDLRLPKK